MPATMPVVIKPVTPLIAAFICCSAWVPLPANPPATPPIIPGRSIAAMPPGPLKNPPPAAAAAGAPPPVVLGARTCGEGATPPKTPVGCVGINIAGPPPKVGILPAAVLGGGATAEVAVFNVATELVAVLNCCLRATTALLFFFVDFVESSSILSNVLKLPPAFSICFLTSSKLCLISFVLKPNALSCLTSPSPA